MDSRLAFLVSILAIMIIPVGLESLIRSENAFASGDDSGYATIKNPEDSSITPSSLKSTEEGNTRQIINQQNECQGNIVLCQNILTKIICNDKAVCIIGNLDPFLLVLPY
jgi:hypothetical protein